MEPSSRFFRGSELPRLLVLAAVMVVGWGLVWQFAQQRPQPAEPPRRSRPGPSPVVPDRSVEFETVTDRTPDVVPRQRRLRLCCSRRRASEDPGRTRPGEPPRRRPDPPVGAARALSRRARPPAGHRHAGHPLRVQAEQDRLALRGLDRHARRPQVSLPLRVRGGPRRASRSARTSPSGSSSTAISSRS